MHDPESRPFFIMITKSCEVCGNTIECKSIQQKFCKPCVKQKKYLANIEHRKKVKEGKAVSLGDTLECKKCGKPFTLDHSCRRFCSEECKSGKDGRFHVYILPEAHYAGMTNNLKERMRTHKRKKNVKNYEVVASYDCPKKAHLHETQLHVEGYEGFFVERSYL